MNAKMDRLYGDLAYYETLIDLHRQNCAPSLAQIARDHRDFLRREIAKLKNAVAHD